MDREYTMENYTVHATIKYLGAKGYKISTFMPGRDPRVYTAPEHRGQPSTRLFA